MISKTQFVSSAQQEIEAFSGPYAEEKKDMATAMLNIGLDWAAVRPTTGAWFGKYERKSRRQYKRECRQYILDNYKEEPQISGFIFSSAIFWMVFNFILNWIINKIVDNYVLSEEQQ